MDQRSQIGGGQVRSRAAGIQRSQRLREEVQVGPLSRKKRERCLNACVRVENSSIFLVVALSVLEFLYFHVEKHTSVSGIFYPISNK